MTPGSLTRRGLRRGKRVVRAGGIYALSRALGAVTSVETNEPVVALTFDDGPHPASTPRLLDVLERHGARATFFVVGESAAKWPDLIERIARSGHAIGNHSWDHPSFPAIGGPERRRQISGCERAIAGHTSRLFRPPYAHQDLPTMFDVRRLGFRTVMYNVTGNDWRDDSAETVCQRLERGLKPGSILLLHDALFTAEQERYRSRVPTLDAVRMLLETHGRAYRFVTVPELLRLGRARKEWWHKPGDAAYLATLRRGHA
jgi:peptidoglycan-N-acetylglucosamine deacetylase